jgi:hypothetical protein
MRLPTTHLPTYSWIVLVASRQPMFPASCQLRANDCESLLSFWPRRSGSLTGSSNLGPWVQRCHRSPSSKESLWSNLLFISTGLVERLLLIAVSTVQIQGECPSATCGCGDPVNERHVPTRPSPADKRHHSGSDEAHLSRKREEPQ